MSQWCFTSCWTVRLPRDQEERGRENSTETNSIIAWKVRKGGSDGKQFKKKKEKKTKPKQNKNKLKKTNNKKKKKKKKDTGQSDD